MDRCIYFHHKRNEATQRVPQKHISLITHEANDYWHGNVLQTRSAWHTQDKHRRESDKNVEEPLIAILCGTDTSFPFKQWDRLTPQAVRTLNMLRFTNIAPKVSCHTYMYSVHDYNSEPFAPMGCAIQAHNKPNRRKTWDQHSVNGWYLRTISEHYRSYKFFKKYTQEEAIMDTMFFKHKYLTNPTITLEDQVIQAAQDLTKVIWKNLLVQKEKKTTLNDLEHLSKVFTQAAQSNGKQTRVQNPKDNSKQTRVLTEPLQRLIVKSPPKNIVMTGPPASNTRSKTQTITQDCIYSVAELGNYRITNKNAYVKKYQM